MKVLQFQGDGRYTTESVVYSPPLGTDLVNFTLCTWFRVGNAVDVLTLIMAFC